MTRISRCADSLVKRLKRCAATRQLRFVREYACESAELPITGMLAAVSLTQITRENGFFGGWISSRRQGDLYTAGVEIRVYAPRGENGSGLSEAVISLTEALETADIEHVIDDVAVSPIEFDADLGAIFRRLTFKMTLCVGKEE